MLCHDPKMRFFFLKRQHHLNEDTRHDMPSAFLDGSYVILKMKYLKTEIAMHIQKCNVKSRSTNLVSAFTIWQGCSL